MSDYIGRKQRTPAPQPAPQPVGESLIDFARRTSGKTVSAVAEGDYTPAERARATAIRYALDCGALGRGELIPHRLAPLVYEGRPMPLAFAASTSGAVRSKIAADVNASFESTQPVHPRRDMSTDPGRQGGTDTRGNPRPPLPYRLQQIADHLYDYDMLPPWPENAIREAMDGLGVSNLSERLSTLVEAHQLGLVEAPSQEATRTKTHRAHDVVVRQQSAGRGKGSGRTMQASVGTRGAYSCAYDGTSIAVAAAAE